MVSTVNVLMKDMPCRLKAMTTANADDSYTIFLNSRLNIEQQRLGYMHELEHIAKGDYEKKDVGIIEMKAHKKANLWHF